MENQQNENEIQGNTTKPTSPQSNSPQTEENRTDDKRPTTQEREDQSIGKITSKFDNNTITDGERTYRITKKFEHWVELYLDRNNPLTYGNATQAALIAYSLDPVKQYHTARQMGYENLTKHDNLRAMYAESKGISLAKLLDVQIARALDPQQPNNKSWFDDLMIDLGYRKPKGAEVMVQTNIQNNTEVNVTEAEKESFNEKFIRFIEQS